MTPHIEALTQRYKSHGILVDTNLLLLLFVGSLDPDLIGKWKRTVQYAREDYETLAEYLAIFTSRVTTPNILTEVSNLAGSLGEKSEAFFVDVFAKAVDVLNEEYVPSNTLTKSSAFHKHGLTDSGIMSLVKGRYLLLTDDFKLSQYFTSVGGDAINFNHIRTQAWE